MALTSVVNIRNSSYDVYIGRAGKGEDGYFGNPHDVDRPCRACNGRVHSRTECLELYTEYFADRLLSDAEFESRIHALRGKTLGCFCKPQACHGDVIAEYLDAVVQKEPAIGLSH